MLKICVIGAGNGGQALAGYLSMKGYDVSLYNRSDWRIEPIKNSGKIILEGEYCGEYEISLATTDIKSAIKNREVILVVVPAFAHRDIAEKLVPYLEDNQIVVLNPGRTGGALEFRKVLRDKGCRKKVFIAEAQTFIFASRCSNPGVVRIFRKKNAVPVSCLPAKDNLILQKTLIRVMPEFEIVKNIVITSFNNIGAVFHPATTILNVARIEFTFGKFEFYFEGISPSVAKVLEAIDEERCNVMKIFKEEPLTAKQWLKYAYDVDGRDLYEAIHSNSGYRDILAPTILANRYIIEDVPMSLVPISSFGKYFGVPTPTIDATIHLVSVMMGEDYFSKGRTVRSLGLEGMTVDEIIRYIEVGEE